MLLRALKFFWRRYRLSRHQIVRQCFVPTCTAGARSGLWTVFPDGLKPDSIVYSFGVGDNIDWELDLIERFGVTVHAFDPTPASVAWIETQSLPDRFHFSPVGIAAQDGFCSFQLPRRGSRFNFHPVLSGNNAGSAAVRLPVRRLATLMAERGHQRLDLVKMDIEGGEYAVLDNMLDAGIAAAQVLVEFHHHFRGVGLGETVRSVRRLNSAGYRIFHISERGLEFSFLKHAEEAAA